jgi:hypothetical protein
MRVQRNNCRNITPPIIATLVAGLILALPSTPAAHEVPTSVTIQMFVKPDGDRLHLLVRVPMTAMRDLDFPTLGPGYLDIENAEFSLRNAALLWIANDVRLYENDTDLGNPQLVAARVSLPSDRSFEGYDEALANIMGPPLPNDTSIYWNQGLLDAHFEFPIESDQSEFSIHPQLERLGVRTLTVLRFLPPGDVVRAFEYLGDPGLVRLDPRWHQAALQFVELGFLHILDGPDHLLFLVCLVIPFRRFRPLITIVTAFTIAHSVTLIASAYGFAPDALWFPPLVEMLIAISIVYMAFENIVGARLKRRWVITFAFGLVHGFGFAFILRQTMQFAGSHMLTSLLSFNIGVELGQLLVLVALIPLLELSFRYVVAERMGTVILSALVAHTGWHWMTDRAAVLSQFQLSWAALDGAWLASVVRWGGMVLIFAGLVWVVFRMARYPAKPREEGEAAAGPEE